MSKQLTQTADIGLMAAILERQVNTTEMYAKAWREVKKENGELKARIAELETKEK